MDGQTGWEHFIPQMPLLGSIRAGKVADLVIPNSDPLTDIRNTMNIGYVMKGGILYQDETLRVVWGGKRASR
jgi:hypothetical protein